jgi:hypothetical protein
MFWECGKAEEVSLSGTRMRALGVLAETLPPVWDRGFIKMSNAY